MSGELDLHLGTGGADGVDRNDGVVALEEKAGLAGGGERLGADEARRLVIGLVGIGVDVEKSARRHQRGGSHKSGRA